MAAFPSSKTIHFQMDAAMTLWSSLRRLLRALPIGLLAYFAPGAFAAALPADGGVFNVRDYGAKGDGKADDTQAIRAAIAGSYVDQGKGGWPSRTVYFPAGIYRVTGTIDNRDERGLFRSSMVLVGESTQSVRLQLTDTAEGFQRIDVPKAVLFTSSKLLDGSATNGGKNYVDKGEGNDAYGNFVEDMTIDVGHGNPGAVAIDYLANNFGALRRIQVVAPAGSGLTGISMDRKWPGPLLLSDVLVKGFDIGISVSQTQYSVTMENIRLEGQSQVGVRNNGNSVSMRHVSILTDALAVQNLGASGLMVADRVTVKLRSAGARWIDNRGYVTINNVVLENSSSSPGAIGLSNGEKGAYFGSDRLPGFDAAWLIRPEAPPAAFSPPISRWANVKQFGAMPDSGQDASHAIRAALRSGAAVVYFPSGRYEVSEPIEVPASVRRLVGMHSSVSVRANRALDFSRESGIVQVGTGGEPVTIEALTLDNTDRGPQVGLVHTGARTLVLRDFNTVGTGITRDKEAGRLFIENFCCGPLKVAGAAGVWARQFNSEGPSTRIVNLGSPLSILGIKVEQNCTVVENFAGAATEILGGLLYQVQPVVTQKPAFVNHEGGRLALSYTEEAFLPRSNYVEHVVQVGTDRQRSSVIADDLPRRGELARLVPGLVIPKFPMASNKIKANQVPP